MTAFPGGTELGLFGPPAMPIAGVGRRSRRGLARITLARIGALPTRMPRRRRTSNRHTASTQHLIENACYISVAL
jgi:hypothetical protein